MRIWLLTQRLPYAPNRGDRIRAYHILRFLRRYAEVDVFSLVHDEEERSCTGQLDGLASSVTVAQVPTWRNRLRAIFTLLTGRPLTLTLLDAPSLHTALEEAFARRPPDLILAYCSSMAPYAMNRRFAGVPIVLDMVDVDSEKWRALGATARLPLRLIFRREAHCLRNFEALAMTAARATVAVNDREVDALRAINPGATSMAVQNGIALDTFAPPSAAQESASVVFCGVLDYGPNEEACLRLIDGIWPIVIAQRPDAKLLLVGAKPTARLRAAARHPSITVTGAVPDVRPYLWQSAVAAVPLRTARGVQNKVLEALAAGLPVVVSPVVAEGLPAAAHAGTRLADSDANFAEAILEWLRLSPAERRTLAGAANLEQLGWDHQLTPLWKIVQAAINPT